MDILNKHVCRGKRIDNNEWVYGYYVALPEEYSHGKDIIHAIFTTECEHVCMGEYKDYGWYEVKPDSVGRCTGLCDKNLQPLFEGDIVKKSKGEVGEIGWYSNSKAGTSFIVAYTTNYDMIMGFISKDIEVIGNKSDNPELLVVKLWT